MPSSGRLLRISVTTSREAEEAVSNFIEEWFGYSASSYLDIETGLATVSVYMSEQLLQGSSEARKKGRHGGIRKSTVSIGPLSLNPSPLEGEREESQEAGFKVQRRKAQLLAGNFLGNFKEALLAGLSSGQLSPGPLSVSCAKLRAEDWAESWKRHFHPLSIGRSLLIKPSWSRKRAVKGQATVILDPGLSFGTGQHPTTAFCLQQLVAQSRKAKRQSFLDVGTGSGILAIAAAKLGYAPVEAFDFDRDSIRVASANARLNQVSAKVHLHEADITKMPRRSGKRYNVICANLLADLLLNEREKLLTRLSPSGVLVLAGILETEFSQVQETFEASGLRLLSAKTKNEWRSGTFCHSDGLHTRRFLACERGPGHRPLF